MGYQIQYDRTAAKKKRRWEWKPPTVNRNVALRVGCLLLVLLLAAACVLPQVRLSIRNLLLPGDPEVTALALEKMVDAIQDGQAVKTAWMDFCREVIQGGLQAA